MRGKSTPLPSVHRSVFLGSLGIYFLKGCGSDIFISWNPTPQISRFIFSLESLQCNVTAWVAFISRPLSLGQYQAYAIRSLTGDSQVVGLTQAVILRSFLSLHRGPTCKPPGLDV